MKKKTTTTKNVTRAGVGNARTRIETEQVIAQRIRAELVRVFGDPATCDDIEILQAQAAWLEARQVELRGTGDLPAWLGIARREDGSVHILPDPGSAITVDDCEAATEELAITILTQLERDAGPR